MITCPNCHTQNDLNSSFCTTCGQSLTGDTAAAAAVSSTRFHQRHLAVATGRLLITLLLVWLLRSVFINLSFVEGLRVPEVPFTIEQIITFIAYLIAFILLIAYARTLRSHWLHAYPHLASLTPALTVIVYVVTLSLAYRALLPIFIGLIENPSDFVLVLRVVLAVLALILLSWVGKVIYDALPNWLSRIRFDVPTVENAEIACLNCGRLNPAATSFCGHCGHSLSAPTETPANE